MRTWMGVRILGGLLVSVLLLGVPAAWPLETAVSKTVTVNTDAADFTVVAAVTGQTIRVVHIDAQNIGTTNKITLLLCDGTCATAANVKYRWQLSPATASNNVYVAVTYYLFSQP